MNRTATQAIGWTQATWWLAKLAVGLTAGSSVAQPASAPSGYRCSPGVYSQTACGDGQTVSPPTTPTAAQQQQAREVAQRDARLAEQLRHDRLASERAAARQGPARIGPAKPAAAPGKASSASSPHKRKPKHRREGASAPHG